jgi:aminoglycoside/choline kinase family phosphotransferase
MKKFKLILLIVALAMSSAFTTKLVAEFYTQKMIDELALKASDQVIWGSGWSKKLDQVSSQPNNLYLGNLLYANIHANDPGDPDNWWAAGSYTSEVYKNGWRKMIASKASLAYEAVKRFGPSFFVAYDKALMDKKENIIAKWKDGAQRAPTLNQFSRKKYWADQRKIMDQYNKLIEALLKLDDSKLNRFITDMDNQLWAGTRLQMG